MNSCELTAAITAIANMIASRVTNNNVLNLLALSLTQLGDTLATIAGQRQLLASLENADQNTCKCKENTDSGKRCGDKRQFRK